MKKANTKPTTKPKMTDRERVLRFVATAKNREVSTWTPFADNEYANDPTIQRIIGAGYAAGLWSAGPSR
jgi:hypothetical protein